MPETITVAMDATFGNGYLVPDMFPVIFHFVAISCIYSRGSGSDEMK